jgi:nucleotide-binding universal stress UspA family protein
MSGIKSILLHVDATPASVTRLEVTLGVALRHEARVTALFAAEPDFDGGSSVYSAGALLARQQERIEGSLTPARERLRRIIGAGSPHVDWCELAGDSITHGFLAEAPYADLLVVGQPAASTSAILDGFIESLILDSGRPTLVYPAALQSARVGQRILVAWDGSAPAARALTSSLPFLQLAEEVHVVSWSERPLAAPFSRIDVGRYLRQHGIAASLHMRNATTRVAEELSLLASILRADLVVMGCYGHSRTRERLFGGASRDALTEMPAPLLMAH